jgi:hypothetical protein
MTAKLHLQKENISGREPQGAWRQDNAKPDIENIKDLNLSAVRLTAVQVTKLPL